MQGVTLSSRTLHADSVAPKLLPFFPRSAAAQAVRESLSLLLLLLFLLLRSIKSSVMLLFLLFCNIITVICCACFHSCRHAWAGRLAIVFMALVGTLPLIAGPLALDATTVSGTMVVGLGPPVSHVHRGVGALSLYGTWFCAVTISTGMAMVVLSLVYEHLVNTQHALLHQRKVTGQSFSSCLPEQYDSFAELVLMCYLCRCRCLP